VGAEDLGPPPPTAPSVPSIVAPSPAIVVAPAPVASSSSLSHSGSARTRSPGNVPVLNATDHGDGNPGIWLHNTSPVPIIFRYYGRQSFEIAPAEGDSPPPYRFFLRHPRVDTTARSVHIEPDEAGVLTFSKVTREFYIVVP